MALEAMQRNGHNLGLGVFECEGLYDTPKLAPVHFDEKTDWISFNCAGTDRRRSVHGVHFFVDDYIFERTWHDPRRYALLLSEFKAAMTPDFSLFTDYPRAVQIYNHYRKHLIGAYSDMFEGAGLGIAHPLGAGHGLDYWSSRGNSKEIFAEIISAEAAHPGSLKAIKEYFPRTYQVYQDMMKARKKR